MLEVSQISKMKKSLGENNTSLPDIFSVLGDRNRYRIMKLLVQEGKMCVSDLASVLGVSVSAVSQHLRILEMSRMVTCERMGQMMCYELRVDDPKIKKIISLM